LCYVGGPWPANIWRSV